MRNEFEHVQFKRLVDHRLIISRQLAVVEVTSTYCIVGNITYKCVRLVSRNYSPYEHHS